MTKKEKELLERVKELIAKWQPLLSLENWTIHCHLEELREGAALSILCSQEGYLDAAVNVSPQTVKSIETLEMLEHCVVHELVHVLIHPMAKILTRELAMDGALYQELSESEESICDNLAGILGRLHAST